MLEIKLHKQFDSIQQMEDQGYFLPVTKNFRNAHDNFTKISIPQWVGMMQFWRLLRDRAIAEHFPEDEYPNLVTTCGNTVASGDEYNIFVNNGDDPANDMVGKVKIQELKLTINFDNLEGFDQILKDHCVVLDKKVVIDFNFDYMICEAFKNRGCKVEVNIKSLEGLPEDFNGADLYLNGVNINVDKLPKNIGHLHINGSQTRGFAFFKENFEFLKQNVRKLTVVTDEADLNDTIAMAIDHHYSIITQDFNGTGGGFVGIVTQQAPISMDGLVHFVKLFEHVEIDSITSDTVHMLASVEHFSYSDIGVSLYISRGLMYGSFFKEVDDEKGYCNRYVVEDRKEFMKFLNEVAQFAEVY